MQTRALLFATLLAPLSALAEPEPGAQANVTITLTRHDYAFIAPDSEVFPESENTKLVKFSYTAKDLLGELLDEGVLGETGSISGWKIVVVDRTPLVEAEHSNLLFYAVKKGVAPVLIPESRLGLDPDTEIGADATVEKYKGETLVSHKESFKSLVSFSGTGGDTDYTFDLNALASGTSSYAIKKLKSAEGDVFTFEYNLLGAVTFKPVLGVYTDHLLEDAQTPVEGSISFSAFVATDITGYPAPEPDPVID